MMSVAIKERPLLLKAWEVKAILAGRKTQFRRPVVLHGDGMAKLKDRYAANMRDGIGLVWWPHGSSPEVPMPPEKVAELCPICQPGDRFWVRETWVPRLASGGRDDINPRYVKYRADGGSESPSEEDDWHSWPDHWRSSTAMPRWASRLTLEVVTVRVERLQEITPEGAIAEGFMPSRGSGFDTPEIFREAARLVGGPYPRGIFAWRWDETHGEGSWASNPWVWSISFKRVESE